MLLFYKLIIVIFLITLSSCNSHKEVHDDDILHIKIQDAKNETPLYASDYISDIEYIALETQPWCLIGEYFNASISENFILVFGSTEANCFFVFP